MALFAVGSTEQHGPHLPLSTDTLIGEALCERVAGALGGAIIAPAIAVGLSGIHMEFPGSLTIERGTLRDTIVSYCQSLARHGIRRIGVLPSHGGNFALVEDTVKGLATGDTGARVVTFTDWPALRAGFTEVMAGDGLAPDAPGLHAGEVETSIMLHLHPELVRMDRAQPGYVGPSAEGRPYSTSIAEVSPIGVLGDPRRASAERGARYVDVWVALAAAAIR